MSSHLMSEMQLTADHLIVIGRGRLIADTSMQAFIEAHSERQVLVRSPHAETLRRLLAGVAQVRTVDAETLVLTGVGAAEVGAIAAGGDVELHELTPVRPSLEEVFMELTYDAVEYRTIEEARA